MMKSLVRRWLILVLCAGCGFTHAGSLALYIFGDDAVTSIRVAVNKNASVALNDRGALTMPLTPGRQSVDLYLKDSDKPFLNFGFEANEKENTDVQVALRGDEKPEILIESYLPEAKGTASAVTGQVSGEIYDAATESLIGNAKVSLSGTDISVMSEADGYFSFEAPRGIYTLEVDHPLFGKKQIGDFRVVAFVDKTVDLPLSNVSDDIEEVEVLAGYKANEFVDKERFAINVVDVLDAEAMARFGDSNAGDALKRVAGVSVVGSKYAVIRGLQGRFIATALNGGTMPSLNPTRRDVALDIFPASVLGGLEIEKSYRPELPGNTTGGFINMSTKKPADDYVNKLSLGLGMTTGVTGEDQITYKGSKTDFFGYDSGIREMPSAIDEATNFGEPYTSSEARNLGKEFTHIYDVKMEKANPDMNIAYALGNYFETGAGDFSFYGSASYKNGWDARKDGVIDDEDGQYDYQRSVFNADLSGYLALGYEDSEGLHRLMSKTIYLHQASDTTRYASGENDEETPEDQVILQWIENTYISQQFSGAHDFFDQAHNLNWFVSLADTHRYEPDRRKYKLSGNAPILSTVERRYGDMTESAMDFGLNYKMTFSLGDVVESTIKKGVYYVTKERDAKLGRFGVREKGNNGFSGSLEEVIHDSHFDEGLLEVSVKSSPSDSYEAEETLKAYYLSTETTIVERFDVLLGVRSESHEQTLLYPFSTASAAGSFQSDDLMPVMGLTLRVDDALQFRASASETVSRPGITERSRAKFYDPETDDLFQGNPSLEDSKIMNFDLRAEYFLDDGNQVSLALFMKEIDSPIEISKFSCSGSACEGYRFVNQDSGQLQGVELDFAMDLFDVGEWSGFMNGNLSYVDSKVKLSLESKTFEYEAQSERKLQGQSDWLGNLMLGLDHAYSGQQFSLSANYFSDRIHRVENKTPNKIEEGRVKLDFVHQWEINESLSLKTKVKNILDSKVTYTKNDEIVESYRQGVGIDMGISVNF